MKCKFCGIENDQVIKDFTNESVCNNLSECNHRLIDQVKLKIKEVQNGKGLSYTIRA
jgi:FKBP-type peptidyl-prolyl cis-trans isomerase (trigger factor)